MSNLRDDAIKIWNAGVDSVRAAPLVRREVRVRGEQLLIGDHSWSRDAYDRMIVVGAGKAATAMASGLLDSIGSWIPITGWINVPEGTESSLPHIHVHPARPAGANEPTQAGVEGTKRMMRLVADTGPRDLCLVLISGGGSALMPAPIDGVTLEDKLKVTRFLSGAGADITELNTVRKHLSQVKGGGLLRACGAGELVTVVLSDVLGDPLDVIASGPTVRDSTRASDAVAVLQRFDPEQILPKRVYAALSKAARAPANDAPMGKSTTIIVGNNAVAVDASGLCAEKLGYNHAMQSARSCEGAAEDVGRHLADMTVGMLGMTGSQHRNDCLITGGEPTVTLAPSEIRGRGGRNQQLVLAAYERLRAVRLSDQLWNRLCILSGGTDGEDGPTDAAGALLDAAVHRRVLELGLDANEFLARNDAYTFFERTGGLLMTGPTGTNVCDIRVAVISAVG